MPPNRPDIPRTPGRIPHQPHISLPDPEPSKRVPRSQAGLLAIALVFTLPIPILAQRVVTITDTFSAGSGGMEVDAEGRIYMSDFGRTLQGPPGTTVYRVTPDGEVAAWAEGLVGASGNAFDSRGRFRQSKIGGRDATAEATCTRPAPSATRTPISRVRRDTLNDRIA